MAVITQDIVDSGVSLVTDLAANCAQSCLHITAVTIEGMA
jgi:hypothetical protein